MEERITFDGKVYTRNGNYAVTKEADCICLYNGKWQPVKTYLNTQKNKRYKYVIVVRSLNPSERTGKGKNRKTTERKYLSRIVAETFVPNPENLPIVTYKNNDSLDCRADNLEWTTNSQIKKDYNKKYSDYRYTKGRKCYGCGKLLADLNDKDVCSRCVKRLPYLIKQNSAKTALEKANADIDRIRNENGIERADHIKMLRDAGVTMKDIGNLYGFSKQRVQQILNRGEGIGHQEKSKEL